MVKPAGLLSNRYKLEDIPDLTGKVAIIVGGSRGIGEAVLMALVKKNCTGMSPCNDVTAPVNRHVHGTPELRPKPDDHY